MQRILVVDDDTTNAKVLRYLLNDEGYEVETVDTAEGALDALEKQDIDLIISEANLAGMSGLELCEEVRRHFRVCFIFLTNSVTIKDKVAGFRAGADDYIVKPYEHAEVVVRIWAILRRNKGFANSQSNIRNNDLELDPVACEVVLLRSDSTVGLTTKECALLHYLISNPGRTLTRDAIMVRVWGYEFQSTSNQLDVYIARLRNKIENQPGKPRLILTERGIGYRFQPSEFPQSLRNYERGADGA